MIMKLRKSARNCLSNPYSKKYDVNVRSLEGYERDKMFDLCCKYAPVYKRYQDWANQYPRILPVFEISDISGEELK